MTALAAIAYAVVAYWLFLGMLCDLEGYEQPGDVVLCCVVILLFGPAFMAAAHLAAPAVMEFLHEREYNTGMGETP